MAPPWFSPQKLLFATCAISISAALGACKEQEPTPVTAPPTSASVTATTQPLPQVAPPPCPAEQLAMQISPAGGGAGSTFSSITLTNNGPACHMAGFAGVSLIDAAGNQLGAPATRDGDSAGGGLIKPGGSVEFGLRSSNPHIHGCTDVVDSTAVKVYPPNDTGWLTAPVTLPTCLTPAVETLSVTAVR